MLDKFEAICALVVTMALIVVVNTILIRWATRSN